MQTDNLTLADEIAAAMAIKRKNFNFVDKHDSKEETKYFSGAQLTDKKKPRDCNNYKGVEILSRQTEMSALHSDRSSVSSIV